MNCGDEPFVVQDGDRIAQLVVAKYESIRWTVVPMLDQTDRGSGGHGSTGRN